MAKKLRLTVLAALFLASGSLAACGGGGGSESGDSGGEEGGGSGGGETLTIASDIAYRPFEFDQGGEPVGFDIDLMNEIGNRAGFTPEYQNVTFDGIIPGLGSNLYDAAISAMTITPEREEQIDFSDPYFDADQSLMVPEASDVESVEEGLESSVVGVQIGTTGASQAEGFQQDGLIGEVRTFDTIEDAFSALDNGQVDAVINDLPVSQDRVNQSDGALKLVQTIPTGEQYGIAFPQDSDMVEPVNQALQEIKDDGTYAEIYEEWIGRAPESIPGEETTGE
ncbi:basic amino acid ABC transporter substrate-binding protein [Rubrobacter indicoceani]|uniref:basic amino acid ABC transporter substrate-binding protein n=1 Tax=Rubrobacter indicoceani TaxID=2051957 RepID=UPI000E5AA97F|nr:basic amino acid ABC transporter substrate-binding protein [Rubrobacter indicoceani]